MQTFLATFYLILLHESVQILTLECIVLNHYGILARAKIVKINQVRDFSNIVGP